MYGLKNVFRVSQTVFFLAFLANAEMATVITNHNLTVRVPQHKVLADELYFPLEVTFTNTLNRDVSLVRTQKDSGLYTGQFLFFSFDRYGNKRVVSRFHATWELLTNSSNRVTLSHGDSYKWDLEGWVLNTSEVFRHHMTNLTCRLRIGENLWVQSDGFSLNVLERNLATNCPVFTGTYSRGGQSTKLTIYRDTIDNTDWLFLDIGQRLCRLNGNEPFTCAMNVTNGIVTITFPQTNRTVIYDPDSGAITPAPTMD